MPSTGILLDKGIDIDAAIAYADTHGRSLAGFEGAEPISNEELLALDVDVLAPCAKENQITAKNAGDVKAKIVAAQEDNVDRAKINADVTELKNQINSQPFTDKQV